MTDNTHSDHKAKATWRLSMALPLAVTLTLALGAAIQSVRADINPVIALFFGYSKAVYAVALSPGGRQAVSGGKDNLLRLWDLPTGLLLRTFDAQTNGINAVAFSADGRRVLTGGDRQLRLWDIGNGQTVKIMEGHTAELTSVAFSADERQALSASKDKTLKLWDLETGQLLKTFEGHADEVTFVAFASDGRQMLSASKDKTLKLWDIDTSQVLKVFEGHVDGVTSAALSKDGRLAVSGGKDKTIRLWDLSTGRPLRTFEGHGDEVLSVAFSGDSARILSGSKDKTLKIWDAQTGALLKTLEGHSDAVSSAVFAADGRQVLSGSLDKTLKLWDVDTAHLKSTVELETIKFAPNGYHSLFSGASVSRTVDPSQLDARLKEKGLKRGDPVFFRIFKGDGEVELWIKHGPRFELFSTYPICAWSGQLGPKLQEGDGQAPEGFYIIGKNQLNPKSLYHRALNLGYPNLLDRAYDRTGSNLMVHGGCASVGCYAMTDPAIDEIWQLVTAALNGNQERIAAHVFPFRMTDERLAAFAWHPWAEFWLDLKPAYDLFEQTHVPPQIAVCNKRYYVQRGHMASSASPSLQSSCPSSKGSSRQSHYRPSSHPNL